MFSELTHSSFTVWGVTCRHRERDLLFISQKLKGELQILRAQGQFADIGL